MIKKRNEPKNLAKLLNKPGVIVDKTLQSVDYFNITFLPNELVAGKNVIKIQGTQNLIKTTEVQFEIFDANGTPIFYEVLNYLAADGSRAIVLYIYPETAAGRATLYLAGRALRNAETGDVLRASDDPSSDNYIKTPNVVWTNSIVVNPTKENTGEIIYLAPPKVTIKELIQTFKLPNTNTVPFKVAVSGSNNTISAIPSNLLPDASVGLLSSTTYTPPSSLNIIKEGQFKPVGTSAAVTLTTDTVLNVDRTVGTSGDVIRLDNKNLLTRVYTENAFFKKDMQGGALTVAVDTSSLLPKTGVTPLGQFINGAYLLSNVYNTTIVEVINDTTAVVSDPFRFYYRVNNVANAIQSVTGFNIANNFTASYIQRITSVSETESSQSYADIYISNLEPAAGDVYKVQTFYKPYGSLGNFTDAGFTLVENTSIMNDSASLVSDILRGQKEQPKGDFTSQAVINNYWQATNVNITGVALPAITASTDRLIDGLTITTGSSITLNDVDATSFNASATYVTLQDNLNVIANTEYKLKFRASGVNSSTYKTTQFPNATIDIYISGSVGIDALVDETITNKQLNARNRKFLGAKNLGTYLGSIDAAGTYLDNSYTFKALADGDIVPLFVVRSGQWTLADVDIIAEKQSGFTPNYTNFKIRIPAVFIDTEMIFNFKYFDSANNPAPVESTVTGIIFKGNNVYIAGGNNLLTGSIFIGNTVGSGIEMAGVSSGFLRSIGYEGYTSASLGKSAGGFMIWSGSVNLNLGVDNYTDVGLELVGTNDNSHLIFSTSGSGKLDIKAETFFIGSNNTQFISGSNGEIEISSSLFWLNPATNTLIIGASASILAPVSAEQIFTPALINGSPSNVTNASSSITSQGFAKFVSASIGGFDISTSQINSTNNRIVLKSNGQLTGSDALIKGTINADTGYFKDINIIGTLFNTKTGPHVTAYTNASASRVIETWIAPTNTLTKTLLSQSFAIGSSSFTASSNTQANVVATTDALTYNATPGLTEYAITGSDGIEFNIFSFSSASWSSISSRIPNADINALLTSSLLYPVVSHGYITSSALVFSGSREVAGQAPISGAFTDARIIGINYASSTYYVTSSIPINPDITGSATSIYFRVHVTGSENTNFTSSIDGVQLNFGRLGWKLTGPVWTGSVTSSGNPFIEYYKDYTSFPDYRRDTTFRKWNQEVNSFDEYQFSSSFDLNSNTITPFSGFIFISSSYAIVSQSIYSVQSDPTYERVINYTRGTSNVQYVAPTSSNQYGTVQLINDSSALITGSYNNASASASPDSVESDWIDITSIKNSDNSLDGLKLQFSMRWVDNLHDTVDVTSYFINQRYNYKTYDGHNQIGLNATVIVYGENLDTGIPTLLARVPITLNDGTYTQNTYTWYVFDEFIDTLIRNASGDDIGAPPDRIKLKIEWSAETPNIGPSGYDGITYAFALGRFNGIALSELRLVKAAEAKSLSVTDLKIRNTSITTTPDGNSLILKANAILPNPGKTAGNSTTTIGTSIEPFNAAYINGIYPTNDAAYNLGSSSKRWNIVYAAGGVVTTSDRNQKTNIQLSDLGLAFINQLTPVSYNWISNRDKSLHYGLIAQDLKQVLTDNNKDNAYMAFDGTSIAYAELIGPMIKAIQELTEKVTRLETALSASKQ